MTSVKLLTSKHVVFVGVTYVATVAVVNRHLQLEFLRDVIVEAVEADTHLLNAAHLKLTG